MTLADTGPQYGAAPEIVRDGDLARLIVTGEIDLVLAGELRRVLADEPAITGLVVDLRAATFIDSGGMAALLNGCRRATRAGIGYAVLVQDGVVRDALDRCRLGPTLGCEDSEDAAARRARR